MSRKEVPRAGLLKAALSGRITNAQGAQALRLSVRQFQRLKQRFHTEGAAGLRHRSRGRPSPRRLPTTVRERVATLLQTTYQGFNDSHLTEKLFLVEGLTLSRESVRRLRRTLGLPAKHRRRPRGHRARRIPEAQLGTLVQVDASPFDWLEGRGPAMTLHGAIDDATGTVLALHFRPTEDLHGYAVVLEYLFREYGLPLALYGDRINILVRNDAHWSLTEQLQGTQTPTHLGRVLQELGIGYIQAGSPQAKGRVERLWRTLQDRLASELRLRGSATLEAANAFLPEFLPTHNARFAHPAADATPAWRHAPKELALLLACRYQRTVARDNTVRLGPRCVQIPPGPRRRSYAGCRVELRELLDGRLVVCHDGTLLVTQPSPGPDFTLKPRRAPSSDRRTTARQRVPHRVAATQPHQSAPHLAQEPRSPRGPRSSYPRQSALAPSTPPRWSPASRPEPRHPWRHAITRRARALYPQRG